MTRDAENPDETKKPASHGAEVSVLDHALWARFTEDRNLDEFVKIWLALQIRQTEGVTRGVIVLEAPDGGGFRPVAVWPADGAPGQDLTDAIETALDRESGATSADMTVAVPLTVDGDVLGAVAHSLDTPDRTSAVALLRKLQWDIGWLTSAIRREMMRHQINNHASMSGVLDIIGATLDTESLEAATLATANLAARELKCAQVGIGFRKGNRLRLRTLSDVADFRLNTNRTQLPEAVLSESYLQEGTVLYPPRDGQDFVVARAHADYADATASGEILTVPLFAGAKIIGAITFLKSAQERFSESELLLAEGVAAALGPVFADRIAKEKSLFSQLGQRLATLGGRLLGPGYLVRKLVVLALLGLIAFFVFAKSDYRIHAEAEVQGQIVRALTTSFDGHVQDAFARAGDIVKAGDVMAALEDRDLRIELLRWQTDLNRYTGEYDRALAERDATESRIARANMDQAQSKIDLVTLQLDRVAIRAPFDGIVIEGDLSQSVGTAVRRGDVIFKLAPLDSYRVALEINETALDDVTLGQQGTLVLASLPTESYAFEVTHITPKLDARDGRNFAIIEASLLEGTAQIRPGMRGVAKVNVSERLLIQNWTQPMIDWVRLALWKWTP